MHPLIFLDHPDDIQDGTKACFGISDDRNTHCTTDAFELDNHLGQRPHSKVWIAQRASRDTAGVVYQRKSRFFDKSSGNNIIGTCGHEKSGPGKVGFGEIESGT